MSDDKELKQIIIDLTEKISKLEEEVKDSVVKVLNCLIYNKMFNILFPFFHK